MKKLPVPENIPLRWELFRGFGKEETIKSSIIISIVLAICIAVCVLTSNESAKVISVFVVLFTMFICAGFFGRIERQSISGYLKNRRKFKLQQQLYKFKPKEAITFVKDEEAEE